MDWAKAIRTVATAVLILTPHPSPYTPHPSPHTLHPTPYTLHLTPHTLHPTPHTLRPTPDTLQPTQLPVDWAKAIRTLATAVLILRAGMRIDISEIKAHWCDTRHPTPHAEHPTPDTLSPAPYTLHMNPATP